MRPDHASSPPLRIVLTGFMGAGKSTVGPILADRLGWRFMDADRYLENKSGSTITELFSGHGEPVFRQMEEQVFAELHIRDEQVIALGGGALESAATRAVLNESRDTCVVFLKAPLPVLLDRCLKQPSEAIRPLLRQREELAKRLAARLPYYEAAHISLDTEAATAIQVTERLLQAMLERYPAMSLKMKAIV